MAGERTMSRSGWAVAAKSAALSMALCSFSLASPGVHAANTTVYRCLDRHLEVVYTDEPCKEGAPLEIRTADADPAALARLERIRDALDQAAVQRLTEERRLAMQSVLPLPTGRNLAESEDGLDYGSYYTYPVGGYAPQHVHRARDHDRKRQRMASRRGAPSPPYIVPRGFR